MKFEKAIKKSLTKLLKPFKKALKKAHRKQDLADEYRISQTIFRLKSRISAVFPFALDDPDAKSSVFWVLALSGPGLNPNQRFNF